MVGLLNALQTMCAQGTVSSRRGRTPGTPRVASWPCRLVTASASAATGLPTNNPTLRYRPCCCLCTRGPSPSRPKTCPSLHQQSRHTAGMAATNGNQRTGQWALRNPQISNTRVRTVATHCCGSASMARRRLWSHSPRSQWCGRCTYD